MLGVNYFVPSIKGYMILSNNAERPKSATKRYKVTNNIITKTIPVEDIKFFLLGQLIFFTSCHTELKNNQNLDTTAPPEF